MSDLSGAERDLSGAERPESEDPPQVDLQTLVDLERELRDRLDQLRVP